MLIACKACGQIHSSTPLEAGLTAKCQRCGSTLARGKPDSLGITTAFSLAALLLYFPANVFPILKLNMHGAISDNTVLEGCVKFYQDGDYPIALIVFMASVLIPLLKLLGLILLVVSAQFRLKKWRRARAWIFRTIEGIGRWAMLDVFAVAILVSLVKLQRIATVVPGSGLAAFIGVVVCTLMASASFDSKLIWIEETV